MHLFGANTQVTDVAEETYDCLTMLRLNQSAIFQFVEHLALNYSVLVCPTFSSH